jgi:Ca2+-binding RTX toxin-like protein
MRAQRSRGARRMGALVFGLTLGSYIVLTAVPASAAPGDCIYNAVSRRITVTQTNSAAMVVTGGAINYDGGACTNNPTVNNTDGVDVVGAAGFTFTIDLAGGPFGPGESPEATGEAEIEFTMDTNVDFLNVEGGSGDDTVVGGVNGVSLNGDDDVDVTIATPAATAISFNGNDGDDTLSAAGGFGAGAASTQPYTINGDDGDDTITGGAVIDTLGGDDGDDTVSGGADNDLIQGGEGSDTLNGDTGNDVIDDNGADDTSDNVPDSDDTINGGPGNDAITAGPGQDVIDDGADDDTSVNGEADNDWFLQGTFDQGADNLIGAGGRDQVSYAARVNPVVVNLATGINGGESGELDTYATIEDAHGGTANDTLTGDGASNVLEGGAGDDHLDGGAGFDYASWATSAAGVTASLVDNTATGDGSDVLSNFEALVGSTHNDTLTGDEEVNEIDGNSGDDTITGGDEDSPAGDDLFGDWDHNANQPATEVVGGNDTINGGDGDDSIFGDDDFFDDTDDGNDTLNGGNGEDDIFGEGGDDTADGGNDDDFIEGDEGDDTLNDTGTTADSLVSDHSDDEIEGDEGDDVISAGEGDDEAFGGDDNDIVHGNDGDDDLEGNDDRDRVFGDAGEDNLDGGEGNDFLAGGAGDDGTIAGGDNFDTISAAGSGCGVTLDLTQGNMSTSNKCSSENEADENITSGENAVGTKYKDTLVGTEVAGSSGFNGNNVLKGGNGKDNLLGLGGSDTIQGGNGNDLLRGGSGDDQLNGGKGHDEGWGGQGVDFAKSVERRHGIEHNG